MRVNFTLNFISQKKYFHTLFCSGVTFGYNTAGYLEHSRQINAVEYLPLRCEDTEAQKEHESDTINI